MKTINPNKSDFKEQEESESMKCYCSNDEYYGDYDNDYEAIVDEDWEYRCYDDEDAVMEALSSGYGDLLGF